MALLPIILLNGTTADANQVMADFNEIYTNIDSSNVASANKTGSGKFVLQTSPTISSPSITSPSFTGPSIFNGNSTFDTSTLFVDSVNHRVGVGTITPSTPFHFFQNINGNAISKFENPNAGSSAAIVIELFNNSGLASSFYSYSSTAGGGLGNSLNINQLMNAPIIFSANGSEVSRMIVGGSFQVPNQLISTVSTGTAPFQVSSTTKVTNLNADLLDGIDSTGFFPATATTGSGNVVLSTNPTLSGATFATNTTLNLNSTPLDCTFKSPGVGTLQIVAGGSFVFILTNSSISCEADTLPGLDNTYKLGNNTHRWTEVWAVNGTIQTSDERDKKEILDSELGLDFIKSLRPVSYHWKEKDNGKHYGLIAQDVLKSLDGKPFFGVQGEEKLGLNYSELIAPIIKAIQELEEKINALS